MPFFISILLYCNPIIPYLNQAFFYRKIIIPIIYVHKINQTNRYEMDICTTSQN